MKYFCDACERLVPPAAFRVEGAVLVLTCSRCAAETRGGLLAGAEAKPEPTPLEPRPALEPVPVPESNVVPLRPTDAPALAAARESAGDAFMAPPGYCPKCIAARRAGEVACASCGLDFERFLPEEHQPSEPLATAWRGVLERWEDAGAHDQVLALAAERGELAMLGRLYRIRLAWVPGDAQARRGREEVLRLVSASSMLTPSTPPDKGELVKRLGVGMLFLILLLAAVLVLRQASSVFQGP